MLCLVLLGAFSYAHDEARTKNEKTEGTPIEIIELVNLSGLDRSNTIVPIINGHVLTVEFKVNLGQVYVTVATAAGMSIECLSLFTPNGFQVYIPNAGNYNVHFTLTNGDEYYGEFEILED